MRKSEHAELVALLIACGALTWHVGADRAHVRAACQQKEARRECARRLQRSAFVRIWHSVGGAIRQQVNARECNSQLHSGFCRHSCSLQADISIQ